MTNSHADAEAFQRLRDAASALVDWAAHAVCEPRRFHENEDNAQQELGRAVARVRGELVAVARASPALPGIAPPSPAVPAVVPAEGQE